MLIPIYPNKDIHVFPDPKNSGMYEGVVCVGGNLSNKTLVNAYNQGVFPWYNEGDIITWWSPAERCLIPTNKIHISKSMARFMKKTNYKAYFDYRIYETIHLCASRGGKESQSSTWITSEMQKAYQRLFLNKVVHNIVIEDENKRIVGGVYGVFVKNIFCGESMFSIAPNASKLALIALSNYLYKNGCKWIDCQLSTKHLISLGGLVMDRSFFINLIENMQENSNLFLKKWKVDG